ncbi:MAG: cobalamin biosynthesis protein CbiQ [Candidatus Cloacimonetes bacterium HGW-Cloacimonetes-3]|jgi:energy-coupling factor transport system permease protein|nr:MAG: cobalamin biosynthesis protein CbiQ [Candidatus Cloacimonetes bacterium HGW-Cloacimonetes-3]
MLKLHLHPLSHILICLVLSSLVFVSASLAQLCLFFGLSIVYSSLRLGYGWRRTFYSLWRSLPFILSIAVLQLIFRQEGEQWWHYGILSISSGGIFWATVLSLRLATVLLCAKAISRSSFQDFQTAFAFVHLPEEFSFMLSYGVQLIPGFSAKLKGFVRSLHLRGIEPSKLPWKQRMAVYKLLAVAALAGIINGSNYAAIALELRGFRSKGKRSFLHKKSAGIADAFMLAGLILLTIFCLF